MAKKSTKSLLDIFAENLKSMRIQKELTQSTVAEKANISVSYISMLERGTRSPTFETLEMLAKVLGVRPTSLLTEGT